MTTNLPATQEASALAVVPDYVKNAPVKGLEFASEYATLPRIKVVQKVARNPEISERFDAGDVIISPDLVLLGKYEQEFPVTPIFGWPSWCQWHDQQAKEAVPIVEEVLEKNHWIARKAKNREETPYENNPKLSYSFKEHLNWLLWLHNEGTMALATYTGGSRQIGKKLNSFIKRVGRGPYMLKIPMFGGMATNPSGDTYYVLQYNSAAANWVSQDDAVMLEEMHDDAERAHSGGALSTMETAVDE